MVCFVIFTATYFWKFWPFLVPLLSRVTLKRKNFSGIYIYNLYFSLYIFFSCLFLFVFFLLFIFKTFYFYCYSVCSCYCCSHSFSFRVLVLILFSCSFFLILDFLHSQETTFINKRYCNILSNEYIFASLASFRVTYSFEFLTQGRSWLG